jgi:perosamine synthetase
VSSVGPFVNRFEQMVAEAAGAKLAVATSSGTTALHLALTGAGVKPGDLVVLPSFTFIASANAIAHCGATPWLVDIDPESWTIDVQLLAREFERQVRMQGGSAIHTPSGRRVAAIVPVYALGIPADMDPLRKLAESYQLPLVADAAAALGATYRGRRLGGLATLTIYSFNGNKTVTAGAGGMIVGDDEALLARLRHLSTTARVGSDYHHDAVGYNYRMTNLQAAVGCAQMERLSELVGAKRRIDRRYREGLAGTGVRFFPEPAWAESACWFSGFVHVKDGPTMAELAAQLRSAGIESRSFWKPIHLQPAFLQAPRTEQPVSESTWSRIITLPCSTQLSEAEQELVIVEVRRALSAAG